MTGPTNTGPGRTTPTKRRPITWKAMVAAEPELAVLEAGCRSVVDDGDSFCANIAWHGHGGIKGRYLNLVGWDRGANHDPHYDDLGTQFPGGGRMYSLKELVEQTDRNEPRARARQQRDREAGRGFLWSEAAYDVGYEYLYDLLPACRACACL